MLPGATREGGLFGTSETPMFISHISRAAAMTTTAFIMKHDTADIAAFIVELTERTPEKDLTMGYLESAVEHKFPGLDDEQLHAAQMIVAAATLKAGR
jgi:hypothetical protein